MKRRKNSDYLYMIKGYNECQGFLFRLGGMYVLKDKYELLNWLYVFLFESLILFFLIYPLPFTVIVALPLGDMFSAFQAIHYLFTTAGYVFSSAMYHLNRKSIDYVLIVIGKGFYQYDEDDISDEADKIIRKNKDFLKGLTKKVMVVVGMTGSAVMFIMPIVEYAKNGGEIPEDAVINPYLPLPLVSYWNEKELVGYIILYILMILTTACVCLELLALSLGYTSLLMTYTTQFTLLNLSISKIEERATDRYRRRYGIEAKNNDKFMDPVFQECMYFCLKENIKHHQALLKWKVQAEKFLGWALLTTFVATSILLAASGFLLMMSQNSIFNSLVLVQVQVVELLHAYLFCWWGQNLDEESSKLPMALYNIPWIYCTTKFKTTLRTMICKSNIKIIPRDPLFKVEASLQTYKSIISTGYSYFNLLRSMN